jgi:hypothetical protein
MTTMNDLTPGIGDNSQALTEEQRQALFFNHRRLYKHALAKKKEADAAFKNACKRAKSEGVDPKMIKFSIDLENDEDGAFDEGKRAGMEGDACSPPYDAGSEAGQAWIKGWHAGQASLAATMELFKGADTSELIPGDRDDDPEPGEDELEEA